MQFYLGKYEVFPGKVAYSRPVADFSVGKFTQVNFHDGVHENNRPKQNPLYRLRAFSLYQSGSVRSEKMGAGRHSDSSARSSLAEFCRAVFDSFAPEISLPGRLTEKGLLAVYPFLVEGSSSFSR